MLGLYLEQRISAGKAAELMGLHKREFVRLLARKGISYLDYSDAELDKEFQAFVEWRKEQGGRAMLGKEVSVEDLTVLSLPKSRNSGSFGPGRGKRSKKGNE